MIKYLGSKRVLIPRLVETILGFDGVRTFFDVFSGTSRVGHAMKRTGLLVTANDHNAYAYALASCYVAANRNVLLGRVESILAELRRVPARAGYITDIYCHRSRFFHPKNGERIDAIRDRIEALDLEPDEKAVALVSLMEAADRVDSTTGVQMAYLKQWAPRAHNELSLRVPDFLPGPGRAIEMEAVEAAREVEADVAYLDPPYNQHNYLRNYHIWETLVRWDAPEVYGVACKRMDCKDRKSAYNSKPGIQGALTDLLQNLNARYVVVSFNNEGYISREDMLELLAPLGDVTVQSVAHDRYVGAKIGIYNPAGEKVGAVRHLKNVEYLFTVRCP